MEEATKVSSTIPHFKFQDTVDNIPREMTCLRVSSTIPGSTPDSWVFLERDGV